MSLSKLGLRNIYKIENNIDFLKNEKQYWHYIEWLESLVITSNINTLDGIKKIVEFEDKCPFCENSTYSKKQEICLTVGCVASF